jgi:excisionase family DNA binding protein
MSGIPNSFDRAFEVLAQLPDKLAEITRQLAELQVAVAKVQAQLPAEMLTIAQTAKRFNVSEQTVRRWVKKGEIPYVKIEGSVRIDVGRMRGFDVT